MYKQYKLIDKSCGDYIEFKKLQKSPEDCHKVAKEYGLEKYLIVEREVTEWKRHWNN